MLITHSYGEGLLSQARGNIRRQTRLGRDLDDRALGVELDQVSVKAKTAEKMGPVGNGEAMEARAVCLVWRP